jgi:hypothetical protein
MANATEKILTNHHCNQGNVGNLEQAATLEHH